MSLSAAAKIGGIISNFWTSIGRTGQMAVKIGGGSAVIGAGVGSGLSSIDSSFKGITEPLEKATGIKGISTILIFVVIGIIGLFVVKRAF